MKKALLIVDIQNDFIPGGALAVNRGDEVIEIANRAMKYFDHVIATQDWHPAGHASFASSHTGRDPFAGSGSLHELGRAPTLHCTGPTQFAKDHRPVRNLQSRLVERSVGGTPIDSSARPVGIGIRRSDHRERGDSRFC